MKTETIVCCVFSLILGMLLSNILKDICDCKAVEGQPLIHRRPQSLYDRKNIDSSFGIGGVRLVDATHPDQQKQ